MNTLAFLAGLLVFAYYLTNLFASVTEKEAPGPNPEAGERP